MKAIQILCWNINGIRAAEKRGLLEWLHHESPDILCLQETKAHVDQISQELIYPPGYHTYWNFPQRRGYSGVSTFTKEEPINIKTDLDIRNFDTEERMLVTTYPQFTLLNVYFPNGKQNEERLQYKMDFYHHFLDFVDILKTKQEKLIVCGDFNTAHKEIDLAHPRENEHTSGFLPMEREWMDTLVAHGFSDTFRLFDKSPGHYTWWDLRTRARERNIGWRLDYIFATDKLIPSIAAASIRSEVKGSDHCPVGINITI